jgi:phosphatidylserine/phosphatidylglycerophosphate/cardiolipin synthase-like enzyme
VAVLVAAGVLILFIIFIFTGSDPTGIFSGGEPDIAPALQPALSSAGGDWWKVHFSEPGAEYDLDNLGGSVAGKLIQFVDSAQDQILISAFEFDLVPLADALIRASERGVEIRWLTDDEYGLEADEEELGLFERLEEAGIEVRDDDRGELMHNKFLVIDNQTVWTGSTNLTENGSFRNNNNALAIGSVALARVYEQEFEEMWAGEFGARAPSNIEQQSLTILGTPIQVYFAAEDKPITSLVPLIEQAQESIKFLAFSFTHDELGQAMLDRAAAGVEVKGIFETRGSETEFSELTNLWCAGLPVRQDGNPGNLHHKVIVVDDRVVVTGSANFSNNGDRFNDENLIILANEDIAREYLNEFDRRWAESREPDGLQC